MKENKKTSCISLTFLLIAQLFFSCGNSEKYQFNPIDELPIHVLKSKKYNFEKLKNPMNIRTKSHLLIVFENSRIDTTFPPIHIIEKNKLIYLRGKGVTGFGPLEISNAELFDVGFNDSTFWVYASMNKRVSEFSLYDTTQLAIAEYKQPENMYLVYNMYFTLDSTFLGLSSSDNSRFVEYNPKGERITGYGEWERIAGYPEMDNYLLQDLNKGWFRVNEDKTFFVKASIFRDRLEIFNYETKEFKLVNGPRLELPKFSIEGSGSNSVLVFAPEEAYGHRDIGFGKTFIYDLYGGLNEQHILETSEVAKTIYLITYEGEIITKLELDRSIRSIAVDENLGKIYGITTDENPGIAVFDIPKELL